MNWLMTVTVEDHSLYQAIVEGVVEFLRSRGYRVDINPGWAFGFMPKVLDATNPSNPDILVRNDIYWTRFVFCRDDLRLVQDIVYNDPDPFLYHDDLWLAKITRGMGIQSSVEYARPDFLEQIIGHLEGIKQLHSSLNELIYDLNIKNGQQS